MIYCKNNYLNWYVNEKAYHLLLYSIECWTVRIDNRLIWNSFLLETTFVLFSVFYLLLLITYLLYAIIKFGTPARFSDIDFIRWHCHIFSFSHYVWSISFSIFVSMNGKVLKNGNFMVFYDRLRVMFFTILQHVIYL